jgi:hypothetical protein
MIPTLISLSLVLAALAGYSLILIAVTGPRAYRNGIRDGRVIERKARAAQRSNVILLRGRA